MTTDSKNAKRLKGDPSDKDKRESYERLYNQYLNTSGGEKERLKNILKRIDPKFKG